MYQFRIPNMKCMGCFNRIKDALEEFDQNIEVKVELKEKVISVISQHTREQLTKVIQNAGLEITS